MKAFTPLFIYTNHFEEDIKRILETLKLPSIDRFLNKFPADVLEAKLEDLNFEFIGSDCLIKVKEKNTKAFKLTNQNLSPFGLTITDKNQFPSYLDTYSKQYPEWDLATVVKKIIQEHCEEANRLTLHSIIDILRQNTLSLHENQGNETKINPFFNVLKELLLWRTEESISISVDALLTYSADISAFISETRNSLSAVAKKEKMLLDIIPKILLAYEKIYYKITLLFPNQSESETRIFIDHLIKNSLNDPDFVENWDFLKLSFSGKLGFRAIFLDQSLTNYNKIQLCCEKPYIEIIYLIEKLSSHASTPDIVDLVDKLNELIVTHFRSLLATPLDKDGKPFTTEGQKLFTRFTSATTNLIQDFKENNPNLNKIEGILNRLLHVIAKIMPSFIISEKQRIIFFKPCANLVDTLETQINRLTPSAA